MRGVKQIKEFTGRMKKHRYSNEFKVTAVKDKISGQIYFRVWQASIARME